MRIGNGKGVIPTLKQRKIASLMLEGKSGSEIARAVGSKAKHIPQRGAEMIKQKGVQVALAASIKQYTPESLRAKLEEIISNPESQAISIRAIELAMREKAMLTERTITEQTISSEELADRAQRAIDALMQSQDVHVHIDNIGQSESAPK